MWRGLNIIITLILCSILCISLGCQDGAEGREIFIPDSKDEDAAEETKNKKPKTAAELAAEAVEVPVAIPVPPPGEPLVPVPVGGSGFGGGSQGAVKPARTGNPDDDGQPGPSGICGNGVQEVLADNFACIFDIYGTTTSGVDGPSTLVGFDFDNDGISSLIGTIGPDIERVSALEITANGTLIGVGEQTSTGFSVYFTVNCQNAVATIIGRTFIENLTGTGEVVTDLDVDSFGRIFAYVDVVTGGNDQLGIINPDTGLFIATSLPSGLAQSGNGIGSSPFPGDTLYLAGNTNISVLNKTTGVATLGPALVFNAPLGAGSEINALDADPFTGIFYGSAFGSPTQNYLVSVNPATGAVTYLADIPPEAADGLDGIAVNRRFETCDTEADTPLPSGTLCADACDALIESFCFDGIDNDGDGATDCADAEDCVGQPCNDANGCTIEDTCRSDEANYCLGTTVNCELVVGNECTVDTCVEFSDEPGDDNFQCLSIVENTDFGGCTPDENCDGERNEDGTCPEDDIVDLCILGQCNQFIDEGGIAVVTCEPASATVISMEENGCVDDNSCTADICFSLTGECINNALSGVFCNDGEDCTTGDICTAGECIGTPTLSGSPCDDGNQCTTSTCNGSGDCIGGPVGLCEGNGDCPSGSCVAGVCACDDGNACTTGDNCGTGSTCLTIPATNGAPCSDGIGCTIESCIGGTCVVSAQVNASCVVDDNFCTVESCTLDGCAYDFVTGPATCSIIVDDTDLCVGTINCDQGNPEAPCVPNVPADCTPIK